MTTTINDRVKLKKNNLCGTVRFVGNIKGKKGTYYGIELDEAKGKNDGSVKNVYYFKTTKNKGIFIKKKDIIKTNKKTNDAPRVTVDDKVKINKFNCYGIIRFIGGIQSKKGNWYGIELETNNGKNNGTIKNRQYFNCKNKYGVFVKAKQITIISNDDEKKDENITNIVFGDIAQLKQHSSIQQIPSISTPSANTVCIDTHNESGNDMVENKNKNEKETEKEIKNDDDESKLRNEWKVGSECEIYSDLEEKWLKGKIIIIHSDNDGEWLTVQYMKIRMKDMKRLSDDIRPINTVNTQQKLINNNSNDAKVNEPDRIDKKQIIGS